MRNYSRLLKDCEVFVGHYVSHHNFSVLTLGLPGKVGYVCAVNSVTSRHLFAPAMI